MAYRYVATTRIRYTTRAVPFGLVELTAETGDELDHDDPATRWAIEEHLLPRGHVERKRTAPDSSEED